MKKKFKKYLPKIIGVQINSLHLVKPKKATQKTFYLFCSPRRGKVKPEQAPFLNQAKSFTVRHKELELQTYHWQGKGKTVLLVHGWESNSHRWKSLIEELQAKDYNIFAFDAPAHGYSEGSYIHVPLYSECLSTMIKNVEPAYIVGHSIGAMTTVFNQHTSEVEIEKLVLLGPPSELTEIMSDFQRILSLKPRVMNDLENYFQEKIGYRFQEFSIAKFAEKLSTKGLLIHDIYDKIAPISASEAIHKNWKNSELLKTEGAGHSLNNSAINSAIIQYLNN
ncbi:alpha/beta hydrolase [Mesonia maritima]|uniref:Pimeloyl-ACP methyl ester carboxylesterase n=1 Tax=Mesonia maritima TaxID=1793873 RepID=A0ABU1K8U9_9FLAO|nr:alpha/beta hydrolase [Mesonia maritima]MDR6302032.1 pimeloyl-ACP methyl ester carboxylesterase [Mesonia maritima]